VETTERLLKVLKDKINERGLTLTEIGDKFSTTHASVSRILNGRNRLTTEDLNQFANLLGIPMSVLLKEAEQKDGRKHIAVELEQYICGDSRIYSIFVMLNFPTTKEAIANKLGLEMSFVEKVLERFQAEKVVYHPGPGLYQLMDHSIEISFGKTKSFYTLKSEIYEIQSTQTYENLSRGKEYWTDKDDSMLMVRLTPAQTLGIAKQLESLSAQIRTMDQMNATPRGESVELSAIFLSLKPMTNEMLKELSKWKDE